MCERVFACLCMCECAQTDDTKSDTLIMIYFLVIITHKMLADTSDKTTGSHTKFIFTVLDLHTVEPSLLCILTSSWTGPTEVN